VTTETERRRKPGRPRKYGHGRVNSTVRFTAQRHAALKAEADKNGRSISEEVEQRIEQSFNRDVLQDVLESFDNVLDQMRELQHQLAATKRENERLAEMIESAVARDIKGESK
jgi:uncharacterized protein Yka (UPF0111/DUF47 family)